MSFAAVMVSALGGYTLFGFFGVIYGPVLMILFLTTVDVYQRHYLTDKIPVTIDSRAADSPNQEMGIDLGVNRVSDSSGKNR